MTTMLLSFQPARAPRAPRPPPTPRALHWPPRLRRAEPPRWTPESPASRRDRRRGCGTSQRSPGARGHASFASYDAALPAPHLHLDRAAGQPLRRQVGHEPGRPRRLEDDDGRLRAARAARRALPRHVVRPARPPSREQLTAAAAGSGLAPVWATNGPGAEELAPSDSSRAGRGNEDGIDFQDIPSMARPGLEPGTPRFSVVCSTN